MEAKRISRRVGILPDGTGERFATWISIQGQFFEVSWKDDGYPKKVEFPGGGYIEAARKAGFFIRVLEKGDTRTPIIGEVNP